ncbi:Peptidoglycan/xylan/chitin deacetylase, PgdA/CDA1 family [Hymenobacter daecheongensis DSM 21074]|uniref:Peptidoglycan/xylan/chitin deacetylase, PgdA/CDA1 family n=1 Tax=Hymenobacter daecheongensis DSM 21074 TaxID=1121955 RepID=A0A1M6I5Q8_9BACT|nr:polysaccharide deacetylase family protein [Hymenobacter daecheongensis]SHJ29704.1 Peptidoglycan/xylan/chitin deacetylase, PgdA/CDA1 family [Hymenobacter daecheongensis DSM 21074]
MPNPVRRLLPQCLWEMPGTGRTLYLTFDDGPIPEETPFVLEQLARFEAKATFFCVGENLARHPDIARQALAAGHRLANHTHRHISGWTHSRPDFVADVGRCQRELDQLLPVPEARPLLRPPFGRITPPLARTLSVTHQVVMWDVLTCDYDQDFAAPRCLETAIRYTKPGSIVVFHDSLKASRNLRYVLPRYLAHFAGLGFRFETL